MIPDAPERFLAAFEKQIDHRHTLETTHMAEQNKRANRGQHYAFTLFLFGLAAAFILGIMGEWIVAVAFLAFDLVGGASVFITGKVSQSRERIRRAEIMTGQRDT